MKTHIITKQCFIIQLKITQQLLIIVIFHRGHLNNSYISLRTIWMQTTFYDVSFKKKKYSYNFGILILTLKVFVKQVVKIFLLCH